MQTDLPSVRVGFRGPTCSGHKFGSFALQQQLQVINARRVGPAASCLESNHAESPGGERFFATPVVSSSGQDGNGTQR